MRSSASAGSTPANSVEVTSLMACNQWWRSFAAAYRRAFSIAIPAAPASARTTTSSSAVNSAPSCFSVR
ncbi:Uncharacterised protein [Mycobacteroides abscessus subsp. abscessus]|nr:Uncharacterised protein [Mycobacteroides abscessus subsp. abscessus]